MRSKSYEHAIETMNESRVDSKPNRNIPAETAGRGWGQSLQLREILENHYGRD
jgi:hypothetical protein